MRDPKPRILIVCEGEKTEPNYFRGFRVLSAVPVGVGCNTLSLVERARELRDTDGGYDQVWCVFDHDENSPDAFNAAIQKAIHSGFRVAYSIEAFELWFCLHFEYITSGLTRDRYYTKLSGLLGIPYEKTDASMYDRLWRRQEDAIRNAKRLLEQYPEGSPSEKNPSTTVHLLVEELNRWARK